MELSFNRVNVLAEEARGQSPSDMITRQHAAEVWYVPFSPIRFDCVADWRFYRRSDNVIIPLFPYRVPASPTDAFGFMFQLGVAALQQLGGKSVKRLHLSLGEPAGQMFDETTEQTVWTFQLGVGVLLD